MKVHRAAPLAGVVGAVVVGLGLSSREPGFLRTGGVARSILDSPARLTVFFWPAAERCSAVELALIGTIEAHRDLFLDTRVVTVVPDGFPGSERYGAPLPGEVIRVPRREFKEEDAFSPFPRVEAWDQDRRLLLFRAISGLRSEERTLAIELERARGLTRPIPTAAAAARSER